MLGGGVQTLTFGPVESSGVSVRVPVLVHLPVGVGRSPLGPVTAARPLLDTDRTSADPNVHVTHTKFCFLSVSLPVSLLAPRR